MASGSSLKLALVERGSTALLGTCTLFNLERQCRRAEVGYELLPSRWGRGLMHEALTELLRFAFEDLGFNRLEADIDPRNEASARSLERLGFSREGYLPERWIVGGAVADTAFYGLLQRTWRARRS